MSGIVNFKKATLNDLDAIMEIFSEARYTISLLGINQWQNGYPTKDDAVLDINLERSYVITTNDKTCGTFAVVETEPTYDKIYEGHWLTGDDFKNYIAVHRVAIALSSRGGGVSYKMIDFLINVAKNGNKKSIRIDTHKGNVVMRKMLEKNGFIYCGIIYLENGDERVAYEKLI